jgi:hypothetical protein
VPPGGTPGDYLTPDSTTPYNSKWETFPNIIAVSDKIAIGGGTTLGQYPYRTGIYIGYNTAGTAGVNSSVSSVVIGNTSGQSLNATCSHNVIVGTNIANNATEIANCVIIGNRSIGSNLTTESGVVVIGSHPGKVGTNNLTIIGDSTGFVALNTGTGSLSFNDYNVGLAGQQLTSMGPGVPPAWKSKSYGYGSLTSNETIINRGSVVWTQAIIFRGDYVTPGLSSRTYFNLTPGRTYKVTVNLGAYNFTSVDGYAVFAFSNRADGSPVVPCAKALLFANNRTNGESVVSSFTSIFTATADRTDRYELVCTEITGQLTLREGFCQILVEDF